MARRTAPIGVPPSGGIFDPPPLFPPNFELLGAYSGWRNDWSHIVAGQFTAGLHSSLLFYEQSTGHAEFYETNGQGGMTLLNQYDDWRTSWAIIVPGYFRRSTFLPENRQPAKAGFLPNTGFLLYDRQSGFGAIYDTNGHGVIEKLAEYGGWRTTWTHIISGRFTTESQFSGLVFYDQASGYAELYATDGAGGMGSGPIQIYNWPKNWTHIVPGEFFNDGSVSEPVITDLFFYFAATRESVTYGNDGFGHFTPVSQPSLVPTASGSQATTHIARSIPLPKRTQLPPATTILPGRTQLPPATIILPGSFGGTEYTNLLFYDSATGAVRFLQFSYSGDPSLGSWSVFEEYTNWRSSWSILVPGNFWMSDKEDVYFPDGGFTDLLCYENDQGYGEFYMHEPPSPTIIEPLAGYASARSVCPGNSISFHVASQVGSYKIRVLRKGLQEVAMADLEVTPADPLSIPRLGYRDGAGWPAVASLTIPGDWPSGLYLARAYVPTLTTPPFGGGLMTVERALRRKVPALDIPFVVRAANTGSTARILLVIPDTTYEAYNFWGGRSLYGYGHNGDYAWAYPQSPFRIPYSFRVSFLRPHTSVGTSANKWQYYEVPLIQWIERQAIRVEYCAASDLEEPSAPALLACYKLVVTVGHSEYWSNAMKGNLQDFIANGGNSAFLGGNICYWQIRFESDPTFGPRMICYKQAPFDPNSTGDASQKALTTVLWRTFVDSDYKLTGVSYEWTTYPPFPQFEVCKPDHWVFANTGLGLGSLFGGYNNGQATIAGPETDSSLKGTTPDNFLLLAVDHASDSSIAGTMGVMENGGTVFTAAATDWALGLSQDDSFGPIDQITRNVLIRLG